MTIYYAQLTDPAGYLQPFIKIGYSKNPEIRIRGFMAVLLATEPGDYRRERQLHWRFDHLREKGEWFRVEDPLLSYVRELMSETPPAHPTRTDPAPGPCPTCFSHDWRKSQGIDWKSCPNEWHFLMSQAS